MEISVIMSVFNTQEQYLREAIDSILNQTFTDFEFIIVDDGSNQETKEMLNSYTDLRIKRICNDKNIGLTASLNKALQQARGKYIARMDADDVSYAERLQKQYEYMEKNPQVDVLGAWIHDGKRVQKGTGNISTEWRWVRMLFGNYGISHPTAFIRHSFLREKGILYNEEIKKSQDYQLWVDCIKNGGQIALYPQVLLYYRVHENQISNDISGEQNTYQRYIRTNLIKELYPGIVHEELRQFIDLEHKILSDEEIENMCSEIEKNNDNKKIYDKALLHYELRSQFRHLQNRKKVEPVGYYYYRMARFIKKII